MTINRSDNPNHSSELHSDQNGIDEQPYHCCAERHFARMCSSAALIHPFAYRLARTGKTPSGVFSASASNMAAYFELNEKTILAGLKDLTQAGFLQIIQKRLYAPTKYKVVTHEEWKKTHPGQCAPKFEYVWAGEGDKLAQTLSAITGFDMRILAFQMVALRKWGLPDAEVVALFNEFINGSGSNKKPKKCMAAFLAWLKLRPRITNADTQNMESSDTQILESTDGSFYRLQAPENRSQVSDLSIRS